jgi:hypothetical protein
MTESLERPRFLDVLGVELSRVVRAEAARTVRVPPRRTPRWRVVLAATAATLAIAGGAGAATGVVSISELVPGGGTDPAQVQQFAPPEATGTFDPALAGQLSVLARARTSADEMGAPGRYVGGDVAPGSSLRIEAPAPTAGTPHAEATTLPSWIVPTSSGAAALYSLSPGATGPGTGVAATVAMLDAGHAWMTTNDDLLGLAPDGVEHVTVTLRDGSQVELPVVGNVFGARFDQGIADVHLGGGQ